jgi:cytoskeletal protein RodZ
VTPKFTRTTIPEKEALGEKLSKKRAALGYDIKEAERATKIRARHLEALESGDWGKLPPDVYVRGFLKNYSAFLKLDESKVLRLYLKERGMAENVKKAIEPKDENRKVKFTSPKVIITPRKIVLFSTVMLGVIIFLYVGYQFSQLFKNPMLTINDPKNNTKVEDDNVIIAGATDPGNKVFINGFEIAPNPDGNFKEKVSLQDGTNIIKVLAKSRLEKTTETELSIVSKPKPITVAQMTEKGIVMKLDIGPNTASILIEVDGKPLSDKSVVMLPGSSQTVKAKDKITITASDGGSVRVNLNGKDLGPLGGPGQKVQSKEFTKDSN